MYQNLHILSLFTKKKLHIFYPVLRSTRNANDQWVIQFDVLWKSWCCRHEDSYNELTVLSFYEIKIDQKVRNLSKQQKTIWSACEVKIEVKKVKLKYFFQVSTLEHMSFIMRYTKFVAKSTTKSWHEKPKAIYYSGHDNVISTYWIFWHKILKTQ